MRKTEGIVYSVETSAYPRFSTKEDFKNTHISPFMLEEYISSCSDDRIKISTDVDFIKLVLGPFFRGYLNIELNGKKSVLSIQEMHNSARAGPIYYSLKIGTSLVEGTADEIINSYEALEFLPKSFDYFGKRLTLEKKLIKEPVFSYLKRILFKK